MKKIAEVYQRLIAYLKNKDLPGRMAGLVRMISARLADRNFYERQVIIKVKYLICFSVFFLILIPVVYFAVSRSINDLYTDISGIIESSGRAERAIIENFPLYPDSDEVKTESRLRIYLLNDHLVSDRKHGVPHIKSDNDIGAVSGGGGLILLEPGRDDLYYFYNVKKTYRRLSPAAVESLKMITLRFQKNLGEKISAPPVKIAVSSALRPENYQNELQKKNLNASVISTHSGGASFDIFFDDYYIMLPGNDSSPGKPEPDGIPEKLRVRTGFLMGDALRSQLRAILAKTLLQLQDEGKIYVTLERIQRCYHISPAG